ncbi:MAG: rhomboid family intramembrane serine protease [Candidatus Limnocylindria bacterium]
MSDPTQGRGTDPSVAGPLDRATALDLLRQAEGLGAAGDYDVAVTAYQRLIGHGDPDIHTAALLGLADARYRVDDEAGAVVAWAAATQAPENELSWRAWKQLAAARVRANDLPAAIAAYQEAERRAPAEERAEIASRLGWLYKETGDTSRARGYFNRARGSGDTPYVTYAILAITIGIGLAQIGGGYPADPFTQLLGLDKAGVAQGELWRLLTVTLVHGGIVHLALNMYALFLVGPLVERLYGHWMFLLMYCVTALAASTLSYVLVPEDAVGASGAIFGLFGVLLTSLWRYKPLVGNLRGLAGQIAVLIVINLVFDFGANVGGLNIDTFAHVGGLLAGMWLGLMLPPRGVQTMAGAFRRPGQPAPVPGPPPLLQAAAVVLLLAVIGAGVLLGTSERSGPGRQAVHEAPNPVVRLR